MLRPLMRSRQELRSCGRGGNYLFRVDVLGAGRFGYNPGVVTRVANGVDLVL